MYYLALIFIYNRMKESSFFSNAFNLEKVFKALIFNKWLCAPVHLLWQW